MMHLGRQNKYMKQLTDKGNHWKLLIGIQNHYVFEVGKIGD
jgi:hypothetical protein